MRTIKTKADVFFSWLEFFPFQKRVWVTKILFSLFICLTFLLSWQATKNIPQTYLITLAIWGVVYGLATWSARATLFSWAEIFFLILFLDISYEYLHGYLREFGVVYYGFLTSTFFIVIWLVKQTNAILKSRYQMAGLGRASTIAQYLALNALIIFFLKFEKSIDWEKIISLEKIIPNAF